jgi:hypothetical protein
MPHTPTPIHASHRSVKIMLNAYQSQSTNTFVNVIHSGRGVSVIFQRITTIAIQCLVNKTQRASSMSNIKRIVVFVSLVLLDHPVIDTLIWYDKIHF